MYLSKCEVVPLGLSQVRITGPCVVTGKPTSVIADRAGLQRWLSGSYIQDAFPDMPMSDREFLISGTSDEGWKQLFPDEDEDDEENEYEGMVGGPYQDDI